MNAKRNLGRVPLNRALSKLGLASRVEATALIEAGRVKVHGKIETDPNRLVNPNQAHIQIDQKKAIKEPRIVILFHKPKGVLTTKRDPEGRRTVYELLPPEFLNLHCVGRLDLHTTGLLLLTNDTQFSAELTDPKNRIPRTYLVTVEGRWTEDDSREVERGPWETESVRAMKVSGKESLVEITLLEGKNREVRRLAESLGHPVRKLKRIRFGDYHLGDLAVGKFETG